MMYPCASTSVHWESSVKILLFWKKYSVGFQGMNTSEENHGNLDNSADSNGPAIEVATLPAKPGEKTK